MNHFNSHSLVNKNLNIHTVAKHILKTKFFKNWYQTYPLHRYQTYPKDAGTVFGGDEGREEAGVFYLSYYHSN